MMNESENFIFAILFTMVYTIVSMLMSFRLSEVLDSEASIEKLTRHFLVWPIELLFIFILSLKIYLCEKYNIKLKLKRK